MMPISKDKRTTSTAPPVDELMYNTMETAPRNGTIILLYPGDVPARHAVTRRFIGGRWVPRPKWVSPATGKTLQFNPEGWRPAEYLEQLDD